MLFNPGLEAGFPALSVVKIQSKSLVPIWPCANERLIDFFFASVFKMKLNIFQFLYRTGVCGSLRMARRHHQVAKMSQEVARIR
jgi:hypothetical protein